MWHRCGLAPLTIGVVAFSLIGCREDDSESWTPLTSASAPTASSQSSAIAQKPSAPPPKLRLSAPEPEAPSSLCSPEPVEDCSLDVVNGEPIKEIAKVSRDANVTLVGWATGPDRSSVPPVVVVVLTGPDEKALYAPAQRITPRLDVAEALKSPALAKSGYDLLTTFKDVKAGEYSVKIAQVDLHGNALVCKTKKRLLVE